MERDRWHDDDDDDLCLLYYWEEEEMEGILGKVWDIQEIHVQQDTPLTHLLY